MRRLWIVILLLLLTACGGTTIPEQTPDSTPILIRIEQPDGVCYTRKYYPTTLSCIPKFPTAVPTATQEE